MADWNKPLLGDPYVQFLDILKLRDNDSITLIIDGATNLPVGTMRYDRTTNCFQEWNGTAWVNRVLSNAGGGTGGIPFGTMASQNADSVNIVGGNITGLNSLSAGGAGNFGGDVRVGGILITGSGGLTLTDALGRIRALSSTFFNNLDGNEIINLNGSNIGTGTVPPGRLGSGTPDATSYLRGDGSWVALGSGAIYTYTTWTPSIGGEGGQTGGSMSFAQGHAVKISNGVNPALVFAQCTVVIGTKPTITGTVVVRGFPYPAATGLLEGRTAAIRFGVMTTNWITIGGYIEAGNTYLVLKGLRAAGTENDTSVTSSDVGPSTSIRAAIQYFTNP